METRILEKQVRLLYMSMCSCMEIPTFAHVNRRTGRKRIRRNDQEVDNVTVVRFFSEVFVRFHYDASGDMAARSYVVTYNYL